jgi:hypothetical protein
MKPGKKTIKFILVCMAVLSIVLSLSFFGCGNSFPYQGSYTGNWTGDIRNISVGGTISIVVDSKGVGTGTIATSNGVVSPATVTGQVDSSGNLTGTTSGFKLNGTTFNLNWQGKITESGNALSMEGTWTSNHGSGTFTATGSK